MTDLFTSIWRLRTVSFLAAAALCLAAGFMPRAALAQDDAGPVCPDGRPVMFGLMDWESGRLHTAVARFLVEEGFGCETDAIPGSTIPLLSGLVRGDLDVVMEVWMDRATKIWDRGVRRGRVASAGINMANAMQGWYVPRYMIEGDADRGIEATAPDLKSVFDLPQYAQLFQDPERPSKGRFYNCVLGWLCEINNTKKLTAYGLDDHFTNFRTGTGAALAAAIVSHYQKGEPFLTYYWDPTWILGAHDMVMLEEPAFNEEDWDAFAAASRPEQATAFPPVDVHVGLNVKFRDQTPALATFFSAYQTSLDDVRTALVHMHDNPRLDGRDLAIWFLKQNPEIWPAWVPENSHARIEAALGLTGADEAPE